MHNRNPNLTGNTAQLEPATLREAYEWYLEDRRPQLSESTMYAHKSRLGHFVRWCEGPGDVENLNNVTGRTLHRFKTWRRNEGDLNTTSVRTQLSTVRVFVKWCEGVNAVTPGTHELVQVPTLTGKMGVDERMLEPEQANDILGHLYKFEYASLRHAMFELLWVTGMRSGGLHSLDVGDYYPDQRKLELRHRPDTGTTLKNGTAGQRNVSLREDTCRVLTDYLDVNRIETEDDHGREPLFTTRHGRATKSHLRLAVYEVSQPCQYGAPCPVGKSPDECEYGHRDQTAGCPENIPPHAIWKGAITWALNNQIPTDAVSDRMNVSPDVLSHHYDHATEDKRMN
jgi:site-specific recombinase XerD